MQPTTLKTAAFQAELDACGQMTKITPTASGLGLRVPGDFKLTWSIRTIKTGSAYDNPKLADCTSGGPAETTGSTAAFRSHLSGAEIVLNVGIDEYGLYWQAQITNPADQTVEAFTFTLHGSGLKQAELTCTIPYCAGWALPLANLEDGDSYCMAYPVKASMQWVDLYTPAWGIYFAVHDPLALYKQLQISREQGRESVAWVFSDLALGHGQTITLPRVYVAVHPGDWHAGAEIYRAWAKGFFHAPEVPDWYRRQPTWAWVGLRGQYEDTPWRKTDGLPEVSKQAAACGIDLTQLTAYTEHGHDTLYPDYRPGPSLGGEAGLRQAVMKIHAAGQRINIYTNGRIVDPASSLTEAQRAAWAVRPRPDSPPAQETYGRVTFDILCPGAAGWQELFLSRLAYLITQFDVDGVYIDQVSAATSLPCYAEDHEHTAPNQAWACYRPFLAQLRRTLKDLKPDLVLATEGVSDVFGQYFDSQQAHQDWPAPMRNKAVPLYTLFRYTFPEFLFNSGCVTQEKSGMDYLKIAHLTGSGFDFGVADWGTVSEDLCRWSRFAVNWREKMADWVQAVPVPLENCPPGIQATRCLRDGLEGSVIHLVWLPDKTDQKPPEKIQLQVPLAGGSTIREVTAETCDGILPVEWWVNKDHVHIAMDFAHLIGLVIQ